MTRSLTEEIGKYIGQIALELEEDKKKGKTKPGGECTGKGLKHCKIHYGSKGGRYVMKRRSGGGTKRTYIN